MSDIVNSLTLLLEEDPDIWPWGIILLLLVWLPGLVYCQTDAVSDGRWTKRIYIFSMFPFLMAWEGLVSIIRQNYQSRAIFKKMKLFEIMFEANLEFMASGTLIILEIKADWIAYVCAGFSTLSIFYGVWSATGSLAESQRQIKEVKVAGRLLEVLLISRFPFAFVYAMSRIYSSQSIAFLVLILLMVSPPSAIESMYILNDGPNVRITTYGQASGIEDKIWFWVYPPTFLRIHYNKLYMIPFVAIRLIPNLFILAVCLYVYAEAELYTGRDKPLFEQIVFVYIFLIQQTLLTVLYIIFPFKPDLFYLENTSYHADKGEEEDVEEAGDVADHIEPLNFFAIHDEADGYVPVDVGRDEAGDAVVKQDAKLNANYIKKQDSMDKLESQPIKHEGHKQHNS